MNDDELSNFCSERSSPGRRLDEPRSLSLYSGIASSTIISSKLCIARPIVASRNAIKNPFVPPPSSAHGHPEASTLFAVTPRSAAETIEHLKASVTAARHVLVLVEVGGLTRLFEPPIVPPREVGHVVHLPGPVEIFDADPVVHQLVSKRDMKEKQKKMLQKKGDPRRRGDQKIKNEKKFPSINQPAGRGHRRG